MKQALLILAHKNSRHLEKLLAVFSGDEDYFFYVHVDPKGDIPAPYLAALQHRPRVRLVSQAFRLRWGGGNVVKCILHLTRTILEDPAIRYVHVISGQDYPLRSSREITRFMVEKQGQEFLNHFPLPTEIWQQGGLWRLDYYNLYTQINAKTFWGKVIIYSVRYAQQLLGLKRSFPANFPALYGGNGWWTLSTECLSYVLDATDRNPALLKRFDYAFCSDEMYFQTLLKASPFADRLVNDNLRYILWEERNGNYPANLDENDYENAVASGCLFARKFEYPVSEKLIARLDQRRAEIQP